MLRQTDEFRLTFELSGSQRQDARPDGRNMCQPGRRAWWPAVGAPLERGQASPAAEGCDQTRRIADYSSADQNSVRAATPRLGSWHIREWPSPWSTATLAPHLAARSLVGRSYAGCVLLLALLIAANNLPIVFGFTGDFQTVPMPCPKPCFDPTQR